MQQRKVFSLDKEIRDMVDEAVKKCFQLAKYIEISGGINPDLLYKQIKKYENATPIQKIILKKWLYNR